jgi:hypothetical protein
LTGFAAKTGAFAGGCGKGGIIPESPWFPCDFALDVRGSHAVAALVGERFSAYSDSLFSMFLESP